MQYRGTDIDQLIAEGNGRLVIKDGGSIDNRGLTVPTRLTEVRLKAAAHLNLPPEHPAVMAEVRRHYHQLSPEHVVAKNTIRPAALVAYTARDHPRRLHYAAGAASRAIAHLIERPQATASRFSAAALLGIGDFADAADTALLGPYSRHLAGSVLEPSVRRKARDLPTWTLHLGEHELQVTPPMLTLAHCLRAVLNGEHAWRTPRGLPHADATIRAVQLLDRYRREFRLSEKHLSTGLRGLINHRTLHRLLRLSDGGSDSPPETLMRLIVRHAAPELEWRSQVPVHAADGTLLTVLDLAAITRRHYLYYDGDHHLDREQRDKDSLITAQLHASGWTGIRVTAGMLEGVHMLNAHLRVLVTPESRAA